MRQQNISPELQYCPQCGDEYRADIVRCAACAVPLLSGKELLAQQRGQAAAPRRPISPDDELVTIQKGPVVQMQMVQAMLKRAGIPSLAAGESSSSCASGGCGGPNLLIQIRSSDYEAAAAALAAEYVRSTGLRDHDVAAAGAVFDAEAETALCPACGCHFSTTHDSCPDCGLSFV